MSDSFVHLHVHSEYSMLDGAARVGQLMQAVNDHGMPAIAVTDHGNNFGAFDFWKQATEAGVKPIIGTEAYLTPGTHRSDKTRVRWGNVAKALGLLAALVAVVLWPRLSPQPPVLPPDAPLGPVATPPSAIAPPARKPRVAMEGWRSAAIRCPPRSISSNRIPSGSRRRAPASGSRFPNTPRRSRS